MSKNGARIPDILSEQKKDAIKLTGIMSLAAIVGRILSIPSGIITAKFLGPAVFGALAVAHLIIQYSGTLQLGLLQSLYRDVPIAYGRGDEKEVVLIRNTIFTSFSLLSALAIMLLWCLFLAGVTFKGILDLPVLILITFIIIANRMMSFLEAYIKAEGKFMIIGKSDFFLKFITPALNIPAVILFRLKGALFALFMTDLIASAYYLICLKKPKLRFQIEIKKTLQLLKTGFILFVNKLSESVFWNVDVIVLTAMTATRTVGLYTMALNTMGTAEPFSQAINMTVYRKILVDGGKHGVAVKSHFKKYAESYLPGYLMFNSIILGCAILFYRFIIRTILTQYTESLFLMIILGFGYLIYISRTFFTYYLNVTNQLFKWFSIVLAGLSLNALLDYFAIKQGYGLRGVAVACTISFVFIALFILALSLKQIYGTIRSAVALLSKIILASSILMGIILACSRWNFINYPDLPDKKSLVLSGIIDLGMKGIVFSVISVGLFSLIFRQSHAYKEFRAAVSYMWASFIEGIRLRKKSATEAK